MEGGWSTPRPGHIAPGKTHYPLYRRLGGPQGQSERVRKFWPSLGFDPRTVQPVASRYIDWAIPAHGKPKYSKKYLSQCHYGLGKVTPGASFIYFVRIHSNVVFTPNLGESFHKITSYFRWWEDGGIFFFENFCTHLSNDTTRQPTIFATIEVTTSNIGHHSVQKPTVFPHPIAKTGTSVSWPTVLDNVHCRWLFYTPTCKQLCTFSSAGWKMAKPVV